MSEKRSTERGELYDKLTPQRKMLVDMILQNLDNGAGLWKQGWRTGGAPENAVTGKKYRGVNNMFLTFVSMLRGYSDNRWLTFNQMKERDWSFKTDAEGHSLGKKAGVSVEFFDLWDRETKRKFDRRVLDGMSFDERQEYMEENVYPIRKYYTVFNGDLIDGIPAKEQIVTDESAKSQRTDKFLAFWSENEAKIIYGGGQAFYSPKTDEIHLPPRQDFYSLQEFYSTALHELGHSTGHEKRLHRDLSGGFGSESYALEELRAEIASLFMEQDFEVSVNEGDVRNNSAYIENWQSAIKNNPNVLFTAIADAEKISKYVLKKESEMNKKVEPYAITEDENENGETVYRVKMASGYGQTRTVALGEHTDRESLMKEFEQMQMLPYWADKRFKEVSIAELEVISLSRVGSEGKEAAVQSAPVEEEPSKVYMLPSAAAAIAAEEYIEEAKPKARVISEEGYMRMVDRDLIEQAERSKDGETFKRLYNGESVKRTKELDEYALMLRIGLYADGEEQLLRVFKSSGQYDPQRPNDYYEKMAKEANGLVEQKRAQIAAASMSTGNKSHFGLNAKS